MKKWSAHMLTGARNMTSKMRAAGTCRPEVSDPACRRGEARGAWRVARFAVVAVMAVVLGLAGFVASAEAATVTRYVGQDSGTNVGADGTTDWAAVSPGSARRDLLVAANPGSSQRYGVDINVDGTDVTFGWLYTPEYASDTTIAANAVAYLNLRDNDNRGAADTWTLVMYDYDPAGGAGNGVEVGRATWSGDTSNTITERTFTFDNSVFTIASGHRLRIDIFVRTNNSTWEARLYSGGGTDSRLVTDECEPSGSLSIDPGQTLSGNPIDLTSITSTSNATNLLYTVKDPSAAGTTTYDYSTGAGTSRFAYDDFNSLTAMPTTLEPSSELSSTEYTSISVDGDGDRYTNTGSWGGDYQAIRMTMPIAETPADIDSIDVTFDGYSEASEQVDVYVWNSTTSAWQVFDNFITLGTTEATHTASYARVDGFADFINAGEMNVLLIQNTANNRDWTVDYLKLDVNYSSTLFQGDATAAASVDTSAWSSGTHTLYLDGDDITCGGPLSQVSQTFEFVSCALSAPGTPSASNITATTLDLTWTAATGDTVTDYLLNGASLGSTALSTSVGSLNPNTDYSYYVQGVSASCTGPQSGTLNTKTAPGAPTGVTGTATSISAITVSWTAPADGAATYDVYEVGNGTPIATGETGTSFSHTGLGTNTSHQYYVIAKNSNGVAGAQSSNSTLAYTLAAVPGTPTLGAVTTTTMEVTVAANGNPDGTEYVIRFDDGVTPVYVQGDNSVGASPVWLSLNDTQTITVTGLTLGTSYDVDLKARNGNTTETVYGTPATKPTSACTPDVTQITLSSTDTSIVNPETSATLSIAVTGGSGAISSPEWSDDGGSTWYNTATVDYTPTAQTTSAGVTISGQAVEDKCGTTLATVNTIDISHDTRTTNLVVLAASAVATSPTSIQITMPYQGDREDSPSNFATFRYRYQEDGGGYGSWSAWETDADNTSPKTFSLTGLTPDALVDIEVEYSDVGIDLNGFSNPQTLQVQLVSWVDNDMLHNSLRFACSQLAADGSTITTEAACNTAGGLWSPDRRHVDGWGTGSSSVYGAILCSTCHAKGPTETNGNIKRITKQVTLSGIPGAGETVSYTFADGTNSDLGDSDGAHATSNKICEVCHTYSATDPNSPTYNTAATTNGVRFHGYKMDTATVENQSHYIGSDCIGCHEHKIGFRASCNACHDSPPLDADGLVSTDLTGSATWGKHDEHVNGQGYTDCDTCHTGWSAGGEMPKGGEINIGFNLLPATPSNTNSVYDGRSAGAGYNPDTGNTWVTVGDTLTCANYCHGSTIGGDSSKAQWLDTWDNPTETEFQCGDCHGATAASPPAAPASGTSHTTHASSSGMNLDCSFCHGSEYTAGVSAPAGHTDGSVRYNVAKMAGTGNYEHYSSGAAPTYRGVGVGADGGNIAPDAANYGKCSNVSCHWGTTTPTWNNGPTTCTTCHNNGTDDGSLENAAPNSGSHSDHVGASDSYVDCDNCHGTGAITGTHSGHVNNATNFAGDLIPGTNFTDVGGRADTNDTCAVICHQAATWGGSAGAGDITWTTETTACDGVAVGAPVTNYCLDCHSATYSGLSGPTIVPAGGWASATHVNAKTADETMDCRAEERNQCLECHVMHDGTQSTDAVWIPNPDTAERRTALGLDYSGAKHYNSVNLRKAAAGFASQTTEAQICWTCHDSTRNGATVQSEWGVNNNATTGGLNYDYGSLSGSDWTTATWYSAKGAASTEPFWYKRGAIQSTHSVNWTDGSSVVSGGDYNNTGTPDLVSEIRCTYCHDVHNTFAATGHADESGQPYLRGRWKGNPYPEDGAPRSGMVDWTIAGSGSEGYGSVPRASASSTNTGDTAWPQTGGFWIDQNSGDPNSGETQASTAGLCLLCHTKDRAGTAVTIDTMDYEPGENLWVSNSGTGNGHMNAVLGGSGTTNLAYNIFTTPERGSATVQSGDSTKPNYYPNMGGYSETTDRLESYRGTADSAVGLTPYTGNESGEAAGYRGHAFYYFEWGTAHGSTISTPQIAAGTVELVVDGHTDTDGKVEPEPAQTQSQFHTFNCGKCHNPHASRLPKLMITNCLDTKQNTWDDDFGQATGAPSPWTNTYASQWPSAQNCHRLSDGTQSDTTRARGDGWNKVTPW